MKRSIIKWFLPVVVLAMLLFVAACARNNDNGGVGITPPAQETPAPTQQQEAATPGNEQQPEQEVIPPHRLTIAAPYGVHDHDNNPVRQEVISRLEAYTNTEIEFLWYGDGYWDQIALFIATGEIPSIFVVGPHDPNFINGIDAGMFWDITDYLDRFPNLQYVHPVARQNASFNGRLWGIPRSRAVGRNAAGIRQDWLDNLGLRMPTNTDELAEALWQFTHMDPDGNGLNDTHGLAVTDWPGTWEVMQVWFGVPNQWGFDGNGDLLPHFLFPEYVSALTWFRNLYAQGVVTPGFHEIGSGEWDNLIRYHAGFAADVADRIRRNYEHLYNEYGVSSYAIVGWFDGGYGPRTLPHGGFNNVLALSRVGNPTEEEMLRTLAFLDALGDAYATDLLDFGIQGLQWDLDEDGYVHRFTEDERTALGVELGNLLIGFNQFMPWYSSPQQTALRYEARPHTSPIRIQEAEIQPLNEQHAIVNYGAGFVAPTMVELGGALTPIWQDARIDFIRGIIDETGLHAAHEEWRRAGGDAVIAEMNELRRAAQ
jgi:putative aldouronate transport system substrate-binding protein